MNSIKFHKLINPINEILKAFILGNKNTQEIEKRYKLFESSIHEPVGSFLSRIETLLEIEESTILQSIIILDRFLNINPEFKLTDKTANHLIATSLFISMKLNEDQIYSLVPFSKTLMIPPKKLIEMEREFLELIEFQCHVDSSEFEYFLEILFGV